MADLLGVFAACHEQTPQPDPSSTVVHCQLDFSSLFPPIISHSIVSRSSVETLQLPMHW